MESKVKTNPMLQYKASILKQMETWFRKGTGGAS